MAKAVLEYSKEQKEYISAMRKAIEQSKELKKSTGWVVAGFGGETYYCYVGEGNGYQGSCFYPMTNRAVVFDTEKEAQDHCYTGFRNGNGKTIFLTSSCTGQKEIISGHTVRAVIQPVTPHIGTRLH